MLHQLQQLQVLDTALIQSCGYPVHMSYSTFTQQYGVLLLQGTHLEASRETCQHVLETMRLEEWRLGKSQVRSLFVDNVYYYHSKCVVCQHVCILGVLEALALGPA